MARRKTREVAAAALDPAVLRRYLDVVPVNRSRDLWSLQKMYGSGFPRMPFRLHDGILSEMLTHKHWLASVAPADGRTDRIAFDIDAKTEEAQGTAIDRYWHLRRTLGEQRRPLVYRTPSGFGLRVLYRIPRTRLADLIPGPNDGPVASALRSVGMAPANGVIELYPRSTQGDRLPLGRRMPLLDPHTLLPLPSANIGDEYSEAMLLGAITELERWAAYEDESLLRHVEALADGAPSVVFTTDRADESRARAASTVVTTDDVSPVDLPPAPILFETGLTAPGTRRDAEWIIGVAFMSSPQAYGLPEKATREDIAGAIAFWLSQKHNGQSVDWNARLARNRGDVEATMHSFANEYLTRDHKGRTMPDRIAQKVESREAGASFVLAVSPREAEAIFRLAERHYRVGILRYRFECWLFAWGMAVKSTILSDRKIGNERLAARTHPDGSSRRYSIVELRSRRMAAWPHGSGKTKTGQPRYIEFLKVLHDEGIMLLQTPHRRAGFGGADRDYAKRFAVLPPDLDVAHDDVPFDVTLLRSVVKDSVIDGEPLLVAVAMHALYASQRHPTRSERVARYKRRGSKIVEGITALISVSVPVRSPRA